MRWLGPGTKTSLIHGRFIHFFHLVSPSMRRKPSERRMNRPYVSSLDALGRAVGEKEARGKGSTHHAPRSTDPFSSGGSIPGLFSLHTVVIETERSEDEWTTGENVGPRRFPCLFAQHSPHPLSLTTFATRVNRKWARPSSYVHHPHRRGPVSDTKGARGWWENVGWWWERAPHGHGQGDSIVPPEIIPSVRRSLSHYSRSLRSLP